MTDTFSRTSLELVSGGLSACDELAQLDQWVVGRPVPGRDKHGNPTIDKPPFSPHTKRKCSHSNPADWSSYAAAQRLLGRFPWLGFVFHESDPYSGIDLDGCRAMDTGAIESWAQDIINRCASYTEISPSETGVKIWVRGTLPESLKHSMGAHKGIEVYSKQRWFTFTGQQLPGTPNSIADAQPVLDQLAAQYRKTPISPIGETPVRTIRESPGERAAGRASLDDVKARFNAEHSLESLLEGYGAVQTSMKDWSCPWCKHNHTNTLYTGDSRLFSRSPNCIIPQKLGYDAFGLYCKVEHSDNAIAAAKHLNPIAPRPRRIDPPLIEPEYRTQAQAQDAERKRAERRAFAAQRAQDAHTTVEQVQARASADATLSDRAQLALLALMETAGTRDWTRASVARLAEMVEMCERSMHEALRELEAKDYISSGRRNGGTTFRTFLRLQAYVKYADEYILELDHVPTVELVSGGAEAPAPDRALLSAVRELAKQIAEPGWALRDYAVLDDAALNTELDRLLDLAAAQLVTEPVTPDPAEPAGEWASYTPVEPTSAAPYTGKSKRYLDHTERAKLCAIVGRAPLDEQPEPEASRSMPRAPRQLGTPARSQVSAKYRAMVEQMSPAELLGELEKHARTLASPRFRRASWLPEVRAKLALVEQLIARSEADGARAAPRSQARREAPDAVQSQAAFL